MLKIYFLVFSFHELNVSVCNSNTFNHLLIKMITKNYYAGMLLIFQFVENETYYYLISYGNKYIRFRFDTKKRSLFCIVTIAIAIVTDEI